MRETKERERERESEWGILEMIYEHKKHEFKELLQWDRNWRILITSGSCDKTFIWAQNLIHFECFKRLALMKHKFYI
jgi:hypothetical protein